MMGCVCYIYPVTYTPIVYPFFKYKDKLKYEGNDREHACKENYREVEKVKYF